MVMSVGFNPHFHNSQKSLEVHLLHDFDFDFYGARLEAMALTYIRSMASFNSIDELVNAIECDKQAAQETMDEARKQFVIEHFK